MIMMKYKNDIIVMFNKGPGLVFGVTTDREDFATPYWLEASDWEYVLEKMRDIEWLEEYDHALMRCIFTDDEVIKDEI